MVVLSFMVYAPQGWPSSVQQHVRAGVAAKDKIKRLLWHRNLVPHEPLVRSRAKVFGRICLAHAQSLCTSLLRALVFASRLAGFPTRWWAASRRSSSCRTALRTNAVRSSSSAETASIRWNVPGGKVANIFSGSGLRICLTYVLGSAMSRGEETPRQRRLKAIQ